MKNLTGITVTTPQALAEAAEQSASVTAKLAALLTARNRKVSDIAALKENGSNDSETVPCNDQKRIASCDKLLSSKNATAKRDNNHQTGTKRRKAVANHAINEALISFSTTTASIAACADVLAAFSVNWCYSINEFLRCFLNEEYLRKHPNVDPKLVCNICTNLVKYTKLIDTVVDAFMATDLGNSTRESERFILCITAYWCLFCLPTKRKWSFKEDVLEVFDPWLGYSLQRFLWAFFQLDTDAFSNCLKVRTLKSDEVLDDFMLETVQFGWFNILDREFVEQKVLEPFLRNRQRAQAQALENRCKREQQRTSHQLCITKPQPFHLTKPKPPAIYDIEAVPEIAPARPFPRSLFDGEPPLEQKLLAKKREENHNQCMELLGRAQDEAPVCASENYMKSRKRAEKPKDKKPPFKSRPMPQFYSDKGAAGDAGVDSGRENDNQTTELDRQNNRAALLRENYKLKQKRDHVVRRLNGASDAFIKDIEFERRVNERIQQEQTQQALNSINKRVYAMQIFEQAILKTSEVAVQKQAISTQIRQERDKIFEQHEQDVLREREKLHANALAHRAATHDAVEDAMAKTVLERQWQAHLMRMETDQLKLRCIQAKEDDFEKRRLVIGEIKAMRARLAAHTAAELDDTQIAGYGFLTELSLAELRERLQLLKHIHAQELADKNKLIVAGRSADREALVKIKALITKHRRVERNAKPSLDLKEHLEVKKHEVEQQLKTDAQYQNVVKRLHKVIQDRKKKFKALRKNRAPTTHRTLNARCHQIRRRNKL